ncbi:hypothetical protein V1477_001265, partial [Vespula maculifrons]
MDSTKILQISRRNDKREKKNPGDNREDIGRNRSRGGGVRGCLRGGSQCGSQEAAVAYIFRQPFIGCANLPPPPFTHPTTNLPTIPPFSPFCGRSTSAGTDRLPKSLKRPNDPGKKSE